MAQIHKLKDRETGKTLYPETVCGAITDFDSRMEAERQKTDDALSKKVGAVAGKGLSTNDYTNDDKAKLGKLLTNEQFGMSGIFILSADGKEQKDSNYSASGFIPINRQYPIIANVYSTINSSAIALFDATYKFIGALSYGVNTIGGTVNGYTYTLPAAAIPQNAVYFRAGTNKNQEPNSYYSNGPTMESREGAISEAIQASMTAAVDEALIAEATAAGAVYNRATGYFELNTLTDITAAQMRTILAAGARQSSTLSAAYILSAIRTHLPRVGNGQAAYAADTFRSCTLLEDVEMPNLKLQGYVFFDCKRLRSVNWKSVQIYDLNNTAIANFQGCSKLVELRGTLRSNFDFNIADSPLLSLASLQHLVTNAANTSAITVTVHPQVYAKLTDESNAEWNAVLTSAEAKQITFATTN